MTEIGDRGSFMVIGSRVTALQFDGERPVSIQRVAHEQGGCRGLENHFDNPLKDTQ